MPGNFKYLTRVRNSNTSGSNLKKLVPPHRRALIDRLIDFLSLMREDTTKCGHAHGSILARLQDRFPSASRRSRTRHHLTFQDFGEDQRHLIIYWPLGLNGSSKTRCLGLKTSANATGKVCRDSAMSRVRMCVRFLEKQRDNDVVWSVSRRGGRLAIVWFPRSVLQVFLRHLHSRFSSPPLSSRRVGLTAFPEILP